jgi:RNA polymerase sigma factor (sigma-70 family)
MPPSTLGEVLGVIHRLYAAQAASHLTDRELVERYVASHDEPAFAALVKRHGPMVLGVARRVLGRGHDVEDVFQATFLVLVRRIASIKRRQSVASWLHGVAQRIALRARTQEIARRRRERRAGSMRSNPSGNELCLEELCSVLDEELALLPEKYRAPLVHCYLQSQSHEQAARELGCPKITVTKRVSRARELLRRRLSRRGITLAAATLTTALAEIGSAAPLPAMLTLKTIKAGALAAAGKSVAGCLSAGAVALAEEAAAGMLGIKGKLLVAALTIGLAVGGIGWAGSGMGQKAEPVAAAHADNDKARLDDLGDPLPEHALRRFGTGRFRHGNQIQSFAITKDGTMIATGGSGEIRLWDAATGRLVRSMHTDGLVLTLGFSSDGRRLVSGAGVDFDKHRVGRLVIWDTTTGKALQTVRYEPAWVRSAALSPDGKTVVMACDDGLLQIMEAENGAVRHRVSDKGSLSAP